MGATTLYSRTEVAVRILAGEHLIIYRNHLLRITASWLDAHPGGTLALLHFVGRDATDEIDAYHSNSTMKMVQRFSIGRVELNGTLWEPFVPPVMAGWIRRVGKDGNHEWHSEAQATRPGDSDQNHYPSSEILLVNNGTNTPQPSVPTLSTITPPPSSLSPTIQAQYSKAYKELHERIVHSGLYKTHYVTGYGPEIMRYVILSGLSAYTYKHDWLMTSAVFLGLLWHQLAFSAHDLGHMGVTHNWVIDRILAIAISDFIGGLSIGWWVQVNTYFYDVQGNDLTLPPRITMFIIVRFPSPACILHIFIYNEMSWPKLSPTTHHSKYPPF